MDFAEARAKLALVRRLLSRPADGLWPPALSVLAASAVGASVAHGIAQRLPLGAGLVASVALGLASAAAALAVLDHLLGGRIQRDAAFVFAVRRGID